jgi:hypothetical protein
VRQGPVYCGVDSRGERAGAFEPNRLCTCPLNHGLSEARRFCGACEVMSSWPVMDFQEQIWANSVSK